MTDGPLANVLGHACAISVRSVIVPGHVGRALLGFCPWVQDCCAISLVLLISFVVYRLLTVEACSVPMLGMETRAMNKAKIEEIEVGVIGSHQKVCVHAELPPQMVIMPNLLSLYDDASGIDEAARSVSELTKLGWYWQQHEFIPFAPWRCSPRGAVPRKDGGAARGTVDQGAPRPEFEPVQSLNAACRQGRERREVKPRFADLAHIASILLHLADTIGEPVFTVALDFSKYFHQLWFQPAELCAHGQSDTARSRQRSSSRARVHPHGDGNGDRTDAVQ